MMLVPFRTVVLYTHGFCGESERKGEGVVKLKVIVLCRLILFDF